MTLRGELQAVFVRYVKAYKAGDAGGCAAVFTADAKMISPYGPTAHGRAAIEAQHLEWVAGGSESKRLEIIQFGGVDPETLDKYAKKSKVR